MSKKNLQELQEDSKSYFEQYPDVDLFIATQDGLFFQEKNRSDARDHALKTKSETFIIKRSEVFEAPKEKSLTPDESWVVAEIAAFLKENLVEIPKGSKKPDMLKLAQDFLNPQPPTE